MIFVKYFLFYYIVWYFVVYVVFLCFSVRYNKKSVSGRRSVLTSGQHDYTKS